MVVPSPVRPTREQAVAADLRAIAAALEEGRCSLWHFHNSTAAAPVGSKNGFVRSALFNVVTLAYGGGIAEIEHAPDAIEPGPSARPP